MSHNVQYPDDPSAIKPAVQSEYLLVPKPPIDERFCLSDEADCVDMQSADEDVDFEPKNTSAGPCVCNQKHLNDLARDLFIKKSSRNVDIKTERKEFTNSNVQYF